MSRTRAGETSAGARYRQVRLRLALKRLEPVLGPRCAAYVGGSVRRYGLGELEIVGAICGAAGHGAPEPGVRLVRGRLDAAPVLSGALTGVLLLDAFRGAGAEIATRIAAEAARAVQPGGGVLAVERIAGPVAGVDPGVPTTGVAGIEEALRGAGLETSSRAILAREPSGPAAWAAAGRLPRALWGAARFLERRLLRFGLESAAAVEVVVVARRPGGLQVGYPDLRRMIGGFFVPPRWLEPRGRK